MSGASQGDVFLADVAPRIGFDVDPRSGRLLVVVLQGNALNSVLETVLVAPLAPANEERSRFPMHVPVPSAELGGGRPDHVAKIQLLRPVAWSRLSAEPVATVSAATLGRLLATVRRAFR